MFDKETKLKFMIEHYRSWLSSVGLASLDDLVSCRTHTRNGHVVYEFEVRVMGMSYKTGISKAVVDAIISGDPDVAIKEGEAFMQTCGEEALGDGTYTSWQKNP
jgi:hypothetical protein